MSLRAAVFLEVVRCIYAFAPEGDFPIENMMENVEFCWVVALIKNPSVEALRRVGWSCHDLPELNLVFAIPTPILFSSVVTAAHPC